MMKATPALVLRSMLLGVSVGASTAAAQQPGDGQAAPVALPGTRIHELRSAINGQTYAVKVALPVGYEAAPRSDTTRYPALYLVEPLGLFSLMQAFRSSPLVAPGVLLVAIESADQSPGGQMRRATLDYTPRDDSSAWARRALRSGVRFGGAEAFLRVLREEVIPLVERTYRTSGDRGIHGHSMGGLFVAYAMLEAPDLFARYAMTSPSLWWNDKVIMAREPEFARRHPVFAKKVFLSIGSNEGAPMAGALYEFATRLCVSHSGGQYKGLELHVESVPDEEHASPVPLWRALKALYPADTGAAKRRGTVQACGG